MCEYLKRMSPQDAPTDDIRRWSGLAHSVVEYTGPRPFGMDGSVYLWLHERSVTQLLDMCDELDAKFSDLMSENAKLRMAVATAIWVQTVLCADMDMSRCMEECPLYRPEADDCVACDVIRVANELGIEVE